MLINNQFKLNSFNLSCNPLYIFLDKYIFLTFSEFIIS